MRRLSCPIGLPDIFGKEPTVVAISTVAQLLVLASTPVARGGCGA
jgi:xanthine/CO dehydrogenase XdhC/CoxF family maturation factor